MITDLLSIRLSPFLTRNNQTFTAKKRMVKHTAEKEKAVKKAMVSLWPPCKYWRNKMAAYMVKSSNPMMMNKRSLKLKRTLKMHSEKLAKSPSTPPKSQTKTIKTTSRKLIKTENQIHLGARLGRLAKALSTQSIKSQMKSKKRQNLIKTSTLSIYLKTVPMTIPRSNLANSNKMRTRTSKS